MKYRPHERQAAAHRAFLVDGYKRGTIFWARRVGKSIWARHHMMIAALMKQGDYWVVFDTRQHAKDVMWDEYLNTIPKNLIKQANATDLTITFNYIKGDIKLPGMGTVQIEHDTSKLPSKIILTGSDTADRDRGGEAQGILFDEYQDQDSAEWDRVYEKFLATTKGWACFMGTARGYNHWYDLMQHSKEDDKWFHSEATWKANPLITEEWIADSRREAESRGMLDVWLQEFELAFNNPAKAVYPMFNRDVHIISPNDVRLQRDMTWYGVLDFGFAEGHPMAYNLIGIDGDDKWYVTDEIHGTGIHLDDMIERIRKVNGEKRVTAIIADSARPDAIDVLRSKGMPVVPSPKGATKNSIYTGIILLSGRMRPKEQMLGTPQPGIFFASNCKKSIYQFENYSYKESKENRPKDESPLKMEDDSPDAIRYLALYLKYGLVKKREALKSGVKTSSYGILT